MGSALGVVAGQVVAGKYRLGKLLGRGGMGSVWRAEHLTLGSPVAVKVIKPQIATNKTSLQRFLREAKAAALLRSPHVVQILDHGSDGDVAFIAMELLEGESLYQRLKRERRLSPRLCATVMTQIGRAMSKAHAAGIVHRDLKPDNVFLCPNDDELVVKVLDFGIAKSSAFMLESSADSSPKTQTGALLGTPYYMSPEQATASKEVDHRTDLWAMAVIAYECLLGERPFRSDSIGELVLQICARPKPIPSEHGEVPPGFDAWFDRATARDADERLSSASELTRALRAILDDGPGLLTPEEPVPGPRSKPSLADDPPETAATADSPMASLDDDHAKIAAHTPAEASTDRDFPPRIAPRPAVNVTLESEGRPVKPAERNEPGLETLDPLAATSQPRGRSLFLRAAAVAVGGAALVGVGFLLRSSQDPGQPTANTAAGRAALTAEPVATPPPPPPPPAPAPASSSATPLPSAALIVPPAGKLRIAPGEVKVPIKTPKPGPSVDDPLGI